MIEDVIRAAMFCRMPEGHWGAPVLLHGESGTGKTSAARAVSTACGLFHYRLAPSERGEGQFGVVPVPGADGFLHYPPPDWAADIDKGAAQLFVDEIDSVPLALQAPLLGLVQLRTLGSHTFNPRVRVIGAANGVSGTWELREDIRNRFCHIDFEGYDSDAWASNLLSGFAPVATARTATTAADLEAKVTEAWPAAIASARGIVSGFIQRRPDLLHKRPTKGATEAAWPSRRTCEYVTVALASASIHGLSEIDTDTLAGGFVGLPWMREFRAWSAMLDLPLPADVLDEKVKFVHDPRRLDRTLAVLGACAALVIPENAVKRQERAAVAWKLIGTVIKDAADVAIPAAKALIVARLRMKIDEKTLAALHPIMAQAGYAVGA